MSIRLLISVLFLSLTLSAPAVAQELYDVVILGSGPAGLQAAIHASRKKVSVLVLGRQSKSSLFYAHVENFCSLFKVSGEEILRTGRQQAQEFGAKFLEEDVLQITPTSQLFEIKVLFEEPRTLMATSSLEYTVLLINVLLSEFD